MLRSDTFVRLLREQTGFKTKAASIVYDTTENVHYNLYHIPASILKMTTFIPEENMLPHPEGASHITVKVRNYYYGYKSKSSSKSGHPRTPRDEDIYKQLVTINEQLTELRTLLKEVIHV